MTGKICIIWNSYSCTNTDETIFSEGTGFISDAGTTGSIMK